LLQARADRGFGVPWMYQVGEENGRPDTFGIAGNSRLQAAAILECIGRLREAAVGLIISRLPEKPLKPAFVVTVQGDALCPS